MPTKYLSVKEVAQRWRVSHMTIYRLIAEGSLAHTRIGRQIRVEESEADRFIEDNTWGIIVQADRVAAGVAR